MRKLLLIALILAIAISCSQSQLFSKFKGQPRSAKAENNQCGICTIFYGLLLQTKEIYGLTSNETVDRICSYFHGVLHISCLSYMGEHGDTVIEQLDNNNNADIICNNIGNCVYEPGDKYCHLFPLPPGFDEAKVAVKSVNKKTDQWSPTNSRVGYCDIPIIGAICDEFSNTTEGNTPVFDEDEDNFSIRHTLRGFDWRGIDCTDTNPEYYPGRIPIDQDAVSDSNCNGIYGINPTTERPYEEELCADSGALGVILISDSAGAHFHLPGDWFDASKLDNETLVNLTYVLENEADWPHLSFATGNVNITWPIVEDIPTNSVYWRLRNRNLCNNNDYHNIAFNGADSRNVLQNLFFNTSRHQVLDKPALVIYTMFGNDVCSGGSDTLEQMTTPEEFRSNVVQALTNLDEFLPAGSHVVLMGPFQGEVLYPAMANQTYPLGRLHNDVTYAIFYDYLECLERAACLGWQSSNETLRNLTSERSNELAAQMYDIVAKESFQNFDMYATRVPVLDIAAALGDQLYTLIEEIDGFHPDREAQNIIADFLWNELLDNVPHFLGNENPNNPLIHSLFGL